MGGSFLRVWDVSAPGGCCVKAHRQQSAGGVLGVRHPASLVQTEGDTPSRGPRPVVRTKKLIFLPRSLPLGKLSCPSVWGHWRTSNLVPKSHFQT